MRSIHTCFLFLVIASMTGISCRKENMCDCIKRTGDIVTETRELPAFDRILLEDNVNVYITQDSIQKVTVEAGDNLVDMIETEVVNGEIRITNKNRCNWARSYKPQIYVHLHMPEIKWIVSDGVGFIKSTNTITTPVFDYRLISLGDIHLKVNSSSVRGHMHGAGDVYLEGRAEHHACHIVGNGFINAGDLETGYTWIYTNTSGNIYVKVTGLLQVTLDGAGDIIYTGEPNTIDKLIRGTGKLIKQ